MIMYLLLNLGTLLFSFFFFFDIRTYVLRTQSTNVQPFRQSDFDLTTRLPTLGRLDCSALGLNITRPTCDPSELCPPSSAGLCAYSARMKGVAMGTDPLSLCGGLISAAAVAMLLFVSLSLSIAAKPAIELVRDGLLCASC